MAASVQSSAAMTSVASEIRICRRCFSGLHGNVAPCPGYGLAPACVAASAGTLPVGVSRLDWRLVRCSMCPRVSVGPILGTRPEASLSNMAAGASGHGSDWHSLADQSHSFWARLCGSNSTAD